MKPTLFIVLAIGLFAVAISIGGSSSGAQVAQQTTTAQDARAVMFSKLIESARESGSSRVIIALRAPFVPEGELDSSLHARQRGEIKQVQEDLLARLTGMIRDVKKFEYIPFLALDADAVALRALESDASVLGIEEDVMGEPGLNETSVIVGSQAAWAAGYSGAGQTVAIVDSGVDKNHIFLGGRVVSEACYSTNSPTSTSTCPGGVTESTAAGSGLNCPVSISGCAHGTHVAGIAAGRATVAGGVAREANIIAIQMFSIVASPNCSPDATCARYFTSDLIRGLERVRTLKTTIPNIAAANLSLQTGQQFTSNCDNSHGATKAAVDTLRSVGIATVVCSGNYAFTNALTAPACISSAISVGSVDDGSLGTMQDVVSNFSDSSPLLHLLAPGRWITSSVPGNAYENYWGTSMAAPHVTGAYAVLRQRSPNASIGRIVKALTVTGYPVTDSRNGIVKSRIQVEAALNALNRTTPADFDDDGKTDIGIFRPSGGEWWINRSMNGQTFALQFGASTDRITPADYTGDGKADVAFFRPASGEWYVLRSDDFSFFALPFGTNGDTPVPADYDADGKADFAVFRPSSSTWFISQSGGGGTQIFQFGIAGDVPVVADYDADGKADVGIFRQAPGGAQWWIQRSTAGGLAMQFGASTDKAVQGDYTGDGKADIAIWRPATGEWLIVRSEDFSFYGFPFGANGDTVAPGDYDGDGKFDATVFRPASATWFIGRTSAGTQIVQFGANGDRPLANAFVP